MRPGEAVLFRSVHRGRVSWAFPHRLVATDGGRLALYLALGTRGVWMGRDPDGRYMERWARGDDPHPHVWRIHHILWLVPPGEAHMLGLKWNERWELVGWYVNLQAPVEATRLGFDSTDLALDVEVEPDGGLRWKDDDGWADV